MCVGIEAKASTSTGISAPDRAATIRAAIDPATRPDDLARPGHVFPLRARSGGVLVRTGHTEAAVDLARAAGLAPAGAICEIMRPDGTMARVPDLGKFARKHGLLMITIADLVRYRHAPRAAGAAGGDGEAADRVRRVHRARLRQPGRRRDPRRAGARRDRRRHRRHGARAFQVPHGRRVPLGALRLRPAARRPPCAASPPKDAACCST